MVLLLVVKVITDHPLTPYLPSYNKVYGLTLMDGQVTVPPKSKLCVSSSYYCLN